MDKIKEISDKAREELLSLQNDLEGQRKKEPTNKEEIDDYTLLEQDYLSIITDAVDTIRDAEEERHQAGEKFSKEEKAILKEWESIHAKAIKDFKAYGKSAFSEEQVRDILESGELACSKEEHNENLSAATEDYKEARKNRLYDYWSRLGYDPGDGYVEPTEFDWTNFVKKPKKAQLEAILDGLDVHQPNWDKQGEFHEMKTLILILVENFPELVKADGPWHKLSGEKAKSGCLSLVLLGFTMTAFIGLKTTGVI